MKNTFQFHTNNPYRGKDRHPKTVNPKTVGNPKTVKYGTETISYLARKIWFLFLEIIESRKTLDIFKDKIRKWKPDCLVVYVRLTWNMLVSFNLR